MNRVWTAALFGLGAAAAVVAAEAPPATEGRPPVAQPGAPEDKGAKPDTWTWFGMGFESRRRQFGDDGDLPLQPRSGQPFGGAGQSRSSGRR